MICVSEMRRYGKEKAIVTSYGPYDILTNISVLINFLCTIS